MKYQLVKMDAIEFLKQFPDGSVDAIITDPAYESLEKHRSKGTTTRLSNSKGSSNDWFPIFPNERFGGFFAEAYRVLKNNAHLYLYSDRETMFVCKPIGEQTGFKFWKDLIWLKMQKGDPSKIKMGMGYHYRETNERILFFEKGKRKLKDLSMLDVFKYPSPGRNKYPTEKPWEIARDLTSQCTDEGALIVDPFVGGGSTGQGAMILGRNFIGCDIENHAIQYSENKLKQFGASAVLMP